MKHTAFWFREKLYAALFIALALVSGLLTGLWGFSLFAWSAVYIAWKWVEFYRFFSWYDRGASSRAVPDNSGLWEELASQVLKRKNADLKTQKKYRALLQQFNTTAQALPFATVLLNSDNEIQWVNRIAEGILGISEGRDLHHRIDNLLREPKFKALLNQREKDSQVKMIHPLDKDKRVLIRVIRFAADRALLVARDISEQESLQKSRKAFVANASHELRTPLTVITGYLEMLYGDDDLPPAWAKAIEQALEQSRRMNKIIDDMLKLSAIEHERIDDEHDELVQMPQLLNAAFNDIRNAPQAQGHEFSAEIDSQLDVLGDKSELTSVIMNLLNNAVIHTPPGTHIQVAWFLKDAEARLQVSDDGPGIESQHLPYLTERFYRVNNARNKNLHSTGLGLAIVKHICIKHHAKLKIDSQPGQGTTFTVSFSKSSIHLDRAS